MSFQLAGTQLTQKNKNYYVESYLAAEWVLRCVPYLIRQGARKRGKKLFSSKKFSNGYASDGTAEKRDSTGCPRYFRLGRLVCTNDKIMICTKHHFTKI